jgi:hypothetical protein
MRRHKDGGSSGTWHDMRRHMRGGRERDTKQKTKLGADEVFTYHEHLLVNSFHPFSRINSFVESR